MNMRWLHSHRILLALFAAAALAVGVMTILVIRQQRSQADGQVFLEAGGNVGSHPFVPLAAPPVVTGGNRGSAGASFQTAASAGGSSGCNPEKLVTYLAANPQASDAWAQALNSDRTLSWSGGRRIKVQQIPSYIRELTPRLLADDLRVTNHQYTNGGAVPVQSVLEKGTAVLVDANGIARVRCACGNPLTTMVLPRAPLVYRGTPWPDFQPQRVVAIQREPRCGHNECGRLTACPGNENRGDDGRCHSPDPPGRPDHDDTDSKGPDSQQWQHPPAGQAESPYPHGPRRPDGPPYGGKPGRDDDNPSYQPGRPDEPPSEDRPSRPDGSPHPGEPGPDRLRPPSPDGPGQPDERNPNHRRGPDAPKRRVAPAPSDESTDRPASPDRDQPAKRTDETKATADQARKQPEPGSTVRPGAQVSQRGDPAQANPVHARQQDDLSRPNKQPGVSDKQESSGKDDSGQSGHAADRQPAHVE